MPIPSTPCVRFVQADLGPVQDSFHHGSRAPPSPMCNTSSATARAVPSLTQAPSPTTVLALASSADGRGMRGGSGGGCRDADAAVHLSLDMPQAREVGAGLHDCPPGVQITSDVITPTATAESQGTLALPLLPSPLQQQQQRRIWPQGQVQRQPASLGARGTGGPGAAAVHALRGKVSRVTGELALSNDESERRLVSSTAAGEQDFSFVKHTSLRLHQTSSRCS